MPKMRIISAEIQQIQTNADNSQKHYKHLVLGKDGLLEHNWASVSHGLLHFFVEMGYRHPSTSDVS